MQQKNSTLHALILCGGAGTRLWPLSREVFPKQLLKLFGNKSLLAATIERAEAVGAETQLAITNEAQRFLVSEEFASEGITNSRVILEPQGKNTAPAVTLAALSLVQNGQDPLLLVLASDHVIKNLAEFKSAVAHAIELADENYLVTFGVVPTKPETGYGYIQKGKNLSPGYEVARFVEKPSLDKANEYLASGDYLWNSGMFVFKASSFLEEMKKFRPDIFDACTDAMRLSETDNQFLRPEANSFSRCPSESIDYAVMEKTAKAAVVPLNAGWSDIGSFNSLWEESEKDNSGNAFKGDVVAENTKNSLVIAEDRLVTLIGLDNIMVIDTSDAILVAPLAKAQEIKSIVNKLNHSKREESRSHRRVYRPWGWYESIGNGTRYQVKKICVKPGASLSLQMHHHRAEHWVVVTGTAEVECNGVVSLLTENQSTFIPLGHTHRLKNPGKLPLELIEVQSGSYLGEDDIVRIQDHYGRK